ncbi:hypothetical protein A2443_02980 [Candidatus Nomurabacteria bacterium RIFOXYC2_FULL_43_16]|uniref:Uncharacterized protein n=2 Tax=Candidatus Nomuraibacteriota TaxID=1752729 RepID=A0A1F6YPV0_9BACT|nr:MAG: YbaB/EbfC family DNA-binding protein [Parcubacteria group bacterium GW2011_GWC1_42_21]KKS58390.1 MAG: hypothetical protein UV23_C0008G0005 [Candidatus Nomurabacteria bacterium GW2011_GWF1_42_40]KKT00293.1 MAG: hypothetical protein UV77_C0005G0030 [Candidatus Nomurabacteria bacterium GW2011_GWA1_43_17]KKT08097.1 MAG: hypothetical protein UV85_C0001G0030 [Candidatus Nomurabacteria bacterium GW2011_GWB1_43_19]KKT11482.1 MAG: hypothetical protein UV91_C0005G0030 [Candidatus Nomurabacteria b
MTEPTLEEIQKRLAAAKAEQERLNEAESLRLAEKFAAERTAAKAALAELRKKEIEDDRKSNRRAEADDYRRIKEEQGKQWDSFGQKSEGTEKVVAKILPNNPDHVTQKEAEKEIEKLPEADKEKIGWGLNTIGFKVEKMKDDLLVGALNKALRLKKIDKKGTAGRFCIEARDYFIHRGAEALKKAKDQGVFVDTKLGLNIKGKRRGLNISGQTQYIVANIGAFSGNVLRYGRLVADATGLSPSSIPRVVMAAGMATAFASELGKEVRLKNEEVIEKTRIGRKDMAMVGKSHEEQVDWYTGLSLQDQQDIERAQEEAMAIYNNALIKEGKTGGEKVSNAEALKDAYLMQMPKDLQKRLENPSTTNNFIQRIVKNDLMGAISRLNKNIEAIEGDPKLSVEQKESQKEQLVKRQRKSLEDYDRIITQYGTVDELAMGLRYSQTAGKAVVGALQVETLILSVEKIWGALSHALSSSDAPADITTGGHITVPAPESAPMTEVPVAPSAAPDVAETPDTTPPTTPEPAGAQIPVPEPALFSGAPRRDPFVPLVSESTPPPTPDTTPEAVAPVVPPAELTPPPTPEPSALGTEVGAEKLTITFDKRQGRAARSPGLKGAVTGAVSGRFQSTRVSTGFLERS